jgi:hypothetical protein
MARGSVGALLAPGEDIRAVAYAMRKPKKRTFALIGAGAAFTMRHYVLVLTTSRLFAVRITGMGRPQEAELIVDRADMGPVTVGGTISRILRFEAGGDSQRFDLPRGWATDQFVAEIGAASGA